MSSAIDGLKCSEVLLKGEIMCRVLFELVVISISLAMDAFTVSMMYGISMPKGNIKKQSFIAFYFGFFRH